MMRSDSQHWTTLPRVLITVAGVVLAALSAAGCSGSAPVILYPEADLYLVDDRSTGTVYESLRFFIAVRDEDGPSDVASVFVIHDQSELYWALEENNWVSLESQGDDWFGAPQIRTPDGAPLPRGQYRVLVEDRARRRATTSFTVTDPVRSPEQVRFPALSGSGRNITVQSSQTVILRVYDRTGRSVYASRVAPGRLPESVVDALPNQRGLDAYLSTEGSERPRLLSGPFAIR